ncbi:MAG: DUF421 domain-containing protein, partial [Oscillospiraceae bacterium]
MFSLRLMGKRQLGELQPSELVVTILISNIASLPIENTEIPMILGAVPVLALVFFELIVSNVSLQSKFFRGFISGKPIIVIRNGEINQNQLRKLRFSIDDLMESLRQNAIFDVRDVDYAIVETTGKVSILQKFEAQNVTAKMMKINGQDVTPPAVIISDGQLVLSALNACNLDEKWVNETLKLNEVTIKKVFLMTATNKKDYYIVKSQRCS